MNTKLLNQLEKLKRKDIDTRNKLIESGKLYGSYEEEMDNRGLVFRYHNYKRLRVGAAQLPTCYA